MSGCNFSHFFLVHQHKGFKNSNTIPVFKVFINLQKIRRYASNIQFTN